MFFIFSAFCQNCTAISVYLGYPQIIQTKQLHVSTNHFQGYNWAKVVSLCRGERFYFIFYFHSLCQLHLPVYVSGRTIGGKKMLLLA